MSDRPKHGPQSRSGTVMDNETRFNELLAAARTGDRNTAHVLMPAVYVELRRMAERRMRNEDGGHTLQATALVHEVYLKLAGSEQIPSNREHFLALAAQAMRRVLVDHARGKKRGKRGGGMAQVTLSELDSLMCWSDGQLLDLDRALTKLETFDARSAQALELMYFCGLNYREIGEALGIGQSTAYDDVKAAKAWLADEIGR